MKGSMRSRGVIFFLAGLVVLCAAAGCATSTTVQSKGSALGGESGKVVVTESGFLGDYSQLKPGGEKQAALVYINPAAQWGKYKKAILEPVQFWASAETDIPVSDQQALTSYFHNALRENLQARFTLVDQPGPDVLKVQVALTEAAASKPMLRSVSVIVPQARILNKAQSLATGSYAFVGSAQAEGQIVDSMTGDRLAAGIDKRAGSMSLQTVGQSKWGDAQDAMDLWAKTIVRRIAEFQGAEATGTAQP